MNAREDGAAAIGPSETVSPLRFSVTVLVASLVNLALHAGIYVLFLADVYRAHPAGPPDFVRQLNRSQLDPWAMAVTALTMGLFVTVVVHWMRVRDAREGLLRGLVVGSLFWASVNSGLYASSNHFSLVSALLDTPASALCMALSCAAAAWTLRGPRSPNEGTPPRPPRTEHE